MKAEELVARAESLGTALRISEGRLEAKDMDKLDRETRNLLKTQEQEIILILCEKNPEITIPEFPKPYLTEKGELVIPVRCHPRYKYWQRGCKFTWQPVNDSLSLKEILLELRASEEVLKRYLYNPDGATNQKG